MGFESLTGAPITFTGPNDLADSLIEGRNNLDNKDILAYDPEETPIDKFPVLRIIKGNNDSPARFELFQATKKSMDVHSFPFSSKAVRPDKVVENPDSLVALTPNEFLNLINYKMLTLDNSQKTLEKNVAFQKNLAIYGTMLSSLLFNSLGMFLVYPNLVSLMFQGLKTLSQSGNGILLLAGCFGLAAFTMLPLLPILLKGGASNSDFSKETKYLSKEHQAQTRHALSDYLKQTGIYHTLITGATFSLLALLAWGAVPALNTLILGTPYGLAAHAIISLVVGLTMGITHALYAHFGEKKSGKEVGKAFMTHAVMGITMYLATVAFPAAFVSMLSPAAMTGMSIGMSLLVGTLFAKASKPNTPDTLKLEVSDAVRNADMKAGLFEFWNVKQPDSSAEQSTDVSTQVFELTTENADTVKGTPETFVIHPALAAAYKH
ncbi:MAG: hypothetical protein DHS20C10_09950 [marine bacterium B5-7]|nr:MAG: hypothetical protein DHS20C10_09950 [marine bacterium B5-7]